MPIKDYSTTAANNTLTPPNGAPEGMAAGLVNNTIRQIMADTRSWYEGGGWCDLAHVPTFISATSFTIPTDVTAFYAVGRRIRMYGTTMGTLYGFITASTYSVPNTTVTVVLDSGALTSNLSRVDLAFTDQEVQKIVDGAVTATMINHFRNPFMEIAQRGTSGTVNAGASGYTLDGWAVNPTGANVTWQQANEVVAGTVYASRSLNVAGATGLTGLTVYHRIISTAAGQIAGKRVTIQFLISNQTGAALTPALSTYYPASTADTYTSVTGDLATTNLQTIASGGQAIVAYTFNMNSLATRGYGIDLTFGGQLNGSGKNVYISAADIRYTPYAPLGLNNAPPRPEYRPTSIEMPLCQRFFEAGRGYGFGDAGGAGNSRAIMYPYASPKRIAASVNVSNITYGGAGANSLFVEQTYTNMFAARVSTTTSGSFIVDFDFQSSAEL